MLERAATRYPHGKLDGQMLHTHHDQEGYGDGERICYAIVPLYRAQRPAHYQYPARAAHFLTAARVWTGMT